MGAVVRVSGSALGDQLSSLTEREREILELLAEGHRPQTIAAELGLSVLTVRNHVRAILRKLDCHSQLEAAALSRRAASSS